MFAGKVPIIFSVAGHIRIKGDAALTQRVERAYAAIQFLSLYSRQREIPYSPELLAKLDAFEQICKKFDIRRMGEGSMIKTFFEAARLKIEWPDFCKDLPAVDRVAAIPRRMATSRHINDPLAAVNPAIRMLATHESWDAQIPTGHAGTADNGDIRWDGYVRIRVVPGPNANEKTVAFKGGCCTPGKRTYPVRFIPLSETSDKEYRYFKIAGGFPVEPKSYLWVAPVKNPDQVQEVWVDHFIFVRSK